MKLREGNVFTPVCDSVHRGMVCITACNGGLSAWRWPPDTPLDTHLLGKHPLRQPLKRAIRILLECIFTTRKRSLWRLCFYRCLSFCPQGGHAWLLGGACVVALGGMCGCSRGACVVAPEGGVHGCSGGHAWLLPGGVCGCSWGACVVALGGMHGCSRGGMRGCSRGACMVALGGHAWLLWGVCMVFSMRYGQWVGGMHPTGMHTCFIIESTKNYLNTRKKNGKKKLKSWERIQVRIQGGPRGPGPPLTLGFEAPKLSIFGPYLIFP